VAWGLFQKSAPGWARVQSICDFVHRHIAFGYEHARPTMTSWEVFNEGKGVCRDYAHLAITFCRCMNIPARYCTGYLGDIGVPPPYGPMDFAGWFEAYLGGRWHTFDPRNNMPRIGRVLIAQGRDAADVPITHTFGRTVSGIICRSSCAARSRREGARQGGIRDEKGARSSRCSPRQRQPCR
jgi:transglutaminase-like putative cysteine protease